MGRQYDHVDVMAAIGLVATLFGGYLLVTAADGFWQAPIAPRMHSTVDGTDAATGMQYLQPVLGQAIVQDLLLDQEAAATLSASTMELNRAVAESQAMATSLLSPLVLAELRAYGQGDRPSRTYAICDGKIRGQSDEARHSQRDPVCGTVCRGVQSKPDSHGRVDGTADA
jgi:hypothetical protein